jgi:hypothetical protein
MTSIKVSDPACPREIDRTKYRDVPSTDQNGRESKMQACPEMTGDVVHGVVFVSARTVPDAASAIQMGPCSKKGPVMYA